MKKQLKTIISLLMSLILLGSTFGCSFYRRSAIKSYEAKLTPKEVTPFTAEFTSGLNRYGFDVIADLYSDANIAVSPASLELALLMSAMGASDTTKEEMISALRMTGLTDEELRSSAAQLMWRINQNGMETCNSLWLQDGYGFSKNYLDICSQDFMSDLFTVDFVNNADGTEKDINNWAETKTHGRIKDVLSGELSERTRMVLVNALFFLGDWAVPFKANDTYDSRFFGAKYANEVPFMHAEIQIRYYETDSFQLIILPFRGKKGTNGTFAMSFILPKTGFEPEDVAGELSASGFEKAVSGSTETTVRISLPKFRFDYQASLVETMRRLGMNEAFTFDARFGNMLENDRDDLYIEDIVHKTYIRVDEKGAEAAAATVVIMNAKSAPYEDPQAVIFNADHPFLFAIYDMTDGTVLFTGVTAELD